MAVAGPGGSTLLDDTYNASPASTIAALNLLDDLTAPRKIAVLGDMLELGSYEEEGHRKVGCRAADIVDLLLVVGSRADFIAEEAQVCGLAADAVIRMENSQAVVAYLQDVLQPEDVVLVKGSNALKLDEIVATLAATKTKQSTEKKSSG